eukprot:1158630-Pyramimonas_sp.AAC.1
MAYEIKVAGLSALLNEVRMNRSSHFIRRRSGAVELLVYVCPFVIEMIQVSIWPAGVNNNLEDITRNAMLAQL